MICVSQRTQVALLFLTCENQALKRKTIWTIQLRERLRCPVTSEVDLLQQLTETPSLCLLSVTHHL